MPGTNLPKDSAKRSVEAANLIGKGIAMRKWLAVLCAAAALAGMTSTGRADVVKSDGDRLHLRVYKDGRIREIALEMLRVSRLPDADDGKRRYKLERRL